MKHKLKLLSTVLLCTFLLLSGCATQEYHLSGGQPDAPVESDGGRAIKQGDYIYYLNGDNVLRKDDARVHAYRGAICRMKTDGSDRAVLCNDDVSVFNLAGDTIWYVAWENNTSVVYQIQIDGSGRKKLQQIDSIFDAGGYAFCGSYIYYVKSGTLWRMDSSGGKSVQLTKHRVCNVMASDQYVYYTGYENEEFGVVSRISHTSTDPEPITKESGYVVGVHGPFIYYYLFSNTYCYLYDEDTQQSTSVAHLSYEEYCFVPEEGYIFGAYVVDSDTGGLYRIDTASGTHLKLCDDRAERMVYYDGFIYYINDSDLYSLYRIRIDGTDRERLRNEMVSNIDTLDIVDGWLYYFCDDDESRIYRLNVTSLQVQCIEIEDIGSV